MAQKIEGSELELYLTIGGEKSSIFADKVIYDSNLLTFFSGEKEILKINLKKNYKTIYEAFKAIGIAAQGY